MPKRLLPYAVIFLVLQICARVSLLARAVSELHFSAGDIALVITKGMWFDVVTMGWILLPVACCHLFAPNSRRIDASLRFVFSYIFVFTVVAEHLFWSEFSTRFNFIAVDYLVYTQEVIGNIVESYPLFWLLFGIGIVAAMITWLSLRLQPLALMPKTFKKRAAQCAALILACVALHTMSNVEQSTVKNNVEATELAGNGIYNLFSAFWNNEIDYDRFYAIQEDEKVAKNARALLTEKNVKFVHDKGKDFSRIIRSSGAQQHHNVMLVVMESMSAAYMEAFGSTQNITPNLDRFAKEGLFFTNLYATGTRTVRGLEALTLSVPPTPGQSILRRPSNDNLASLGFIMQDRGYDTKFIYGGYGYFDNMNNFFAANGFNIIDRNEMKADEINFANVWGICDEDMFTRAIKEADASYAQKKPFLHLIMTTSNHRPYTYPEGRIDIPSKQSRLGGVKYADYAVGKLIEDAKKKPWFKDTIFIFVADHTAGASGKAELDPLKYHIPMILYAPGKIKPRIFDRLTSQIDFAPTLLGLLNFSYVTKFYGTDVLRHSTAIPYAFISNYQKVALVKNDTLTVLAPKRRIEQYSWPDVTPKTSVDNALVDDAIAYYQSASWWKDQMKRVPSVVKP